MNKPKGIDVPQEFLDRLLKGDPRCRFKIGTRVRKWRAEEGSHHPAGTEGVTIGSIYADPSIELATGEWESELYYVKWDNSEFVTACGGRNLIKI